MPDHYDLERFVSAQDKVYPTVLGELGMGRKTSHWMWYFFPQIAGLGRSAMSRLYAISSLDEARCYYEHGILGPRLRECARLVLDIQGKGASEIFSSPDDMKFHSSMTLFAAAIATDPIFSRAIAKYFGGEPDDATLRIIGMDRC